MARGEVQLNTWPDSEGRHRSFVDFFRSFLQNCRMRRLCQVPEADLKKRSSSAQRKDSSFFFSLWFRSPIFRHGCICTYVSFYCCVPEWGCWFPTRGSGMKHDKGLKGATHQNHLKQQQASHIFIPRWMTCHLPKSDSKASWSPPIGWLQLRSWILPPPC